MGWVLDRGKRVLILFTGEVLALANQFHLRLKLDSICNNFK
jgi:hypothetical protein